MKDKSIAIGLVIILVSVLAAPVSAFGDITHNAITSRLTGVPIEVTTNPSYVRGGDIGPDTFDFLSGSELYSLMAHTQKTADLPRNMLSLSRNGGEKAYSLGWLSHDVSDIIGHRDYVNIIAGGPYPINSNLHLNIEIGGDANVASYASTSFIVPYDLLQRAYSKTYSIAPSLDTIKKAAKAQQSAISVEKLLISWGFYNGLKKDYGKPNFWSNYSKSINYTKSVMNDPFNESLFNNTNLIDGLPITSLLISSETSKVSQSGIDRDILDTSNELLGNGVIEVTVREDKQSKIIIVEELVIKDNKKFNEAIKKLIKSKENKK